LTVGSHTYTVAATAEDGQTGIALARQHGRRGETSRTACTETGERSRPAAGRPRPPLGYLDEPGHQVGDILDTESADQAWTEPRQEMPFQVVAVALERALAARAGFHTPLVALDPPPGDPGEAELRRRQRHAGTGRPDEERPLRPCLLDVVSDGPEPRPAPGHEAHRVLPVRLQVDALLDAHAPGRTMVGFRLDSRRASFLPVRRSYPPERLALLRRKRQIEDFLELRLLAPIEIRDDLGGPAVRSPRQFGHVGIASDSAELPFQEGDRCGAGRVAELQPSDQRPDHRDPTGLLIRDGVPFCVLDGHLKIKPEISEQEEPPPGVETAATSKSNGQVEEQLTYATGEREKQKLRPQNHEPRAAKHRHRTPFRRIGRAAWSPPRQFEFDANVQRGMADRKAWGAVFSDPFVPHHVPHHHF
jgi:hypothetical protein